MRTKDEILADIEEVKKDLDVASVLFDEREDALEVARTQLATLCQKRGDFITELNKLDQARN